MTPRDEVPAEAAVRDADSAVPPAPAPLPAGEAELTLERMGTSFPTRLSFLRSLVRALAAERARVERPLWEIDGKGRGRALYALSLGGRRYSLAAFSQDLDPSLRTDRVIAEAWDATFALCDGLPDAAAMERLAAQVPLQEAGRFRATELVLSRANRSGRIFDHVVEALAGGEQPSRSLVARVGYLMRTTAVYGNGKFGLADHGRIAGRRVLGGPFAAEMLTVWLVRGFSHDLVEHMAGCRGAGSAARLRADIRRHLGIGNATGLGMAPFIVRHPVLVHRWTAAREAAVEKVRNIRLASECSIEEFRRQMRRARLHLEEWNVEHEGEMARIRDLRKRLDELRREWTPARLRKAHPWNRVLDACRSGPHGLRNLMASVVLEPHGDLVDSLCDDMADEGDSDAWDPGMPLHQLSSILRDSCSWAGNSWRAPRATARFWYLSSEKLEPRLGRRHEEPGADRELPLDIARRIDSLRAAVAEARPAMSVGSFVLRHPEHRAAAGRAQTLNRYRHSEVRENLVGEDMRPLDLLRWKLAFFGATKYDPKSDLWLRVAFGQGAPTRHDLGDAGAVDWAFPFLPA